MERIQAEWNLTIVYLTLLEQLFQQIRNSVESFFNALSRLVTLKSIKTVIQQALRWLTKALTWSVFD